MFTPVKFTPQIADCSFRFLFGAVPLVFYGTRDFRFHDVASYAHALRAINLKKFNGGRTRY